MQAFLLILVGSMAGLQAAGTTAQEKSPIPDEAARKTIRSEIRRIFKSEYSRRDRASRKKLAATLLEEANESIARYVGAND